MDHGNEINNGSWKRKKQTMGINKRKKQWGINERKKQWEDQINGKIRNNGKIKMNERNNGKIIK